MRKLRWLVVVLGPLLCFVLLRPQRSYRPLSAESALDGPVLAPGGPLGDYSATAFLGEGWDEIGQVPYRQTRSGLRRGSDLRFYLDRVTPVSVRLEGRWAASRSSQAGEAPEPAQLWLNGRQCWKLQNRSEWSAYDWDIPAAWLRSGENRLELRARRPTQWRRLTVFPTHAGRTFQGRAENEPGRLAFGRSRSYPLQLSAPARLSLDRLEPWVLPGGPALTRAPRLSVELEGAALAQSWTVDRSTSLRLPATSGPARLTLTALGPERPAPGQAGIEIGPLGLEVAGETEAAEPAAPPAPSGRPVNVIVYLIDTLRADHLGCYGYRQGHTPHLDAFAAEAVLFSRCTAQSGWTKPATASVLTSQSPRRHGALDFGDKLRSEAPYLPQLLRQAGYETRGVVTNPFVTKVFGFERGFENFEFLPLASSQRVNQSVLPWLQRRSGPKPFFLYLHTLDPHMPYGSEFSEEQALALQSLAHQQSFWGRTDPKVEGALRQAVSAYDADVSANDASFGQLVEQLKRQGLYDDSLIVVLSDHGEEFLDHGRVGHNNSLYQELLHVPLIVKFPGGRGAGARVNELWQQIDVAPTILQGVGATVPPAMEGRAYYPEMGDGARLRPALISLRSGIGAERWGQGNRPRLLDLDALRTGDWIYLRTRESVDGRLAPRELYDLAGDPGEKVNQAWSRLDLTVAMQAALSLALPAEASAGVAAPPGQVDEVLRSLQYLR